MASHLLGTEQFSLAKNLAKSAIDRFAETSIWSRIITGETGQAAQQSRPLVYHERTWHCLSEISVVQ